MDPVYNNPSLCRHLIHHPFILIVPYTQVSPWPLADVTVSDPRIKIVAQRDVETGQFVEKRGLRLFPGKKR